MGRRQEGVVRLATITGKVTDSSGAKSPIAGATVEIFETIEGAWDDLKLRLSELKSLHKTLTKEDGSFEHKLPPGEYLVMAHAFGILSDNAERFEVENARDKLPSVEIQINLGVDLEFSVDGVPRPGLVPSVTEGQAVSMTTNPNHKEDVELHYSWTVGAGSLLQSEEEQDASSVIWDTMDLRGSYEASVVVRGSDDASVCVVKKLMVTPRPVTRLPTTPVSLRRAGIVSTRDLALWVVIRQSAEAMSFSKESYSHFMDMVLCGRDVPDADQYDDTVQKFSTVRRKRFLPYTDTDAYRLLKAATEAFVMVSCAVALDEDDLGLDAEDLEELASRMDSAIRPSDLTNLWAKYLKRVNGKTDRTLPYLSLVMQKLKDVGLETHIPVDDLDADLPKDCVRILKRKLTNPCLLELIWSYWHEEGMLVQTMNAISRRFQNVRAPGLNDPLANLEIDPLRPLNNLLWGYIQDEQHRLTVVRRAYEYNHHYGLSMVGRAIPELRPADSRSKFLEAFHNLLYVCSIFYKQADDTTIVPDGFPVLNALKEVHLLLSEGAHNQFGDLTSTARIEMLMQQWLLARTEFREFLPTRIMVAYPEAWMDRVDAMKKLQGWTDVSVLHFRDLAVFGEQLLLGIRYGAWSDINNPNQAANWARFWRPEAQGYIHAYRAVTGVDLAAEITDSQLKALRVMQPSALMFQRLQSGGQVPALPQPAVQAPVAGFRQRRAARR